MNIRALTGFVDPGWPLESRRIADLAACLRSAKSRLEEAGYPVQTLRLATPPPAETNRPGRSPRARRPGLRPGDPRCLTAFGRRIRQSALRCAGQCPAWDAVLPGGVSP